MKVILRTLFEAQLQTVIKFRNKNDVLIVFSLSLSLTFKIEFANSLETEQFYLL